MTRKTTSRTSRLELPRQICILDVETAKTKLKEPEKSVLAIVGTQVYSLRTGLYRPQRYRYYEKPDLNKLERFLKKFNGPIIGQNIFGFDYRVLRPLMSLAGIIEKSVDTLAFLYEKNGNKLRGLSLGNLSTSNSGKAKTLAGKIISYLWSSGKRKQVIDYNRNDLRLTKFIWWKMVNTGRLFANPLRWDENGIRKKFRILLADKLHLVGKKPRFTFLTWSKQLEEYGYILKKEESLYKMSQRFEMSQHIPFPECPECGSKNLVKIDQLSGGAEFDTMSEGELAEYMAGTWGTIKCFKCGAFIDYNF